MAEGACLSPRSSMCLSMDLCVCLCLRPQLCHFRNAFHISCRHQREFTGISKRLFSPLPTSPPKPCQCTQPTVTPNSIDFYRSNVCLQNTVITEACNALTTHSVTLGSSGFEVVTAVWGHRLESELDVWPRVWSYSGILCSVQLCGFICSGVNTLVRWRWVSRAGCWTGASGQLDGRGLAGINKDNSNQPLAFPFRSQPALYTRLDYPSGKVGQHQNPLQPQVHCVSIGFEHFCVINRTEFAPGK